MRKHKIIPGAIILIILAFVFLYGGDAPSLHEWTATPKEDVSIVRSDETVKEEYNPYYEDKADEKEELLQSSISENNKMQNGKTGTMDTNEAAANDKNFTEPVFEDAPQPTKSHNEAVTDKEYTCTLSVRCDTILNNIEWLDKEKIDVVPKDGVIFAERTVTFYEGESVFNLLLREMKKNKIHLEFVNTPIYDSAYIEGIANIYEFDCGELSGWMYKVNDLFPNYGCSRYKLKAGDTVEWVYTCNLGKDVKKYLGE